ERSATEATQLAGEKQDALTAKQIALTTANTDRDSARAAKLAAQRSALAESRSADSARSALRKATEAQAAASLAATRERLAAGRERAQKEAAANEATVANRLLYIADMGLIRQSWDASRPDVQRIYALLDETRQSKERNFEWGYWDRASH